jgi:hypothetical protein
VETFINVVVWLAYLGLAAVAFGIALVLRDALRVADAEAERSG